MPGYALLLAVLITGPLLGPGHLLLRDAVSTPQSYLSDAALGLSEAAPRALPQDFLIAVTGSVVDGGVVVTFLLLAGLWFAGWGAARLAAEVLPAAALPGQFVAATVAVWNPYVAERLLQGHWSLLVGYGCLPWVAAAVLRLRTRCSGWGAVCAVIFWIALAGLTPTGLLLAAVVALVCMAAPGQEMSRVRCAGLTAGVCTLTALPWLVAAAMGGPLGSDPGAGIAAFAARAEPGLGTIGSLAGLGGIWNVEAVPDSRTTLFALVGTIALLLIVGAGLPTTARTPAAIPLVILAAAAVIVPAAMATVPGQAVLTAITEAAPGLGVLRDGQKWVALAVPGYTLAAAAATVTLRSVLPSPAAAVLCCVVVLAALPDLVWGVGGKVSAVEYPAGWSAVAAAINAEPAPVTVLPADSMRQFAWSGAAPVLDPLPRWVRAGVLSTGDLSIGGQEVSGEGNRARQVQLLLLDGASPQALADAGVGWVVVESGTPGELGRSAQTLAALSVVYRDADISLYRVADPESVPSASNSDRAVLIGAHLVWLALLLGGAAGVAAQAIKVRLRR